MPNRTKPASATTYSSHPLFHICSVLVSTLFFTHTLLLVTMHFITITHTQSDNNDNYAMYITLLTSSPSYVDLCLSYFRRYLNNYDFKK